MSICRNVGEAAFEFAAVSNMEIYISVIVVRRNCYVNERITNDIFPEFLPLSFLYAKENTLLGKIDQLYYTKAEFTCLLNQSIMA